MRLLLASALALSAGPAFAQGAFFATLAQPAAQARTVARETLWTCAGAECRAARTGTSSDMSECRAVARNLGRISAFSAGERTFNPTQIERCNAGRAE